MQAYLGLQQHELLPGKSVLNMFQRENATLILDLLAWFNMPLGHVRFSGALPCKRKVPSHELLQLKRKKSSPTCTMGRQMFLYTSLLISDGADMSSFSFTSFPELLNFINGASGKKTRNIAAVSRIS